MVVDTEQADGQPMAAAAALPEGMSWHAEMQLLTPGTSLLAGHVTVQSPWGCNMHKGLMIEHRVLHCVLMLA